MHCVYFQVNIFLCFAIFGMLINVQVLYSAFGFYESRPIMIGLMVIFQFVLAPYNEVTLKKIIF